MLKYCSGRRSEVSVPEPTATSVKSLELKPPAPVRHRASKHSQELNCATGLTECTAVQLKLN